MTGTELAALCRYYTKTNSTTFTSADMLPLVNIFKNEIASRIVETNNGNFLVPSIFNLAADQSEYGLPDDMLSRLHKVELKFVSTDSRFPATGVKDYYGSETEIEIVKQFSNIEGEFGYTIRRRALFILSGTIIAVTSGGRIWYHAYPATLANLTGSTDLSVDPTTTTFGFPRQLHELLARRVSMAYKSNQPKPIPLSELKKNYYKDLELQLASLASIDNSMEIIGEGPPDEDTGNHGF